MTRSRPSLVRLHLVAIDDDRELVHLLLGGRLEPLVVLPLLELAVTGHHEDPAAAARARRFAQAIPRPFEIPIPSEPEFASIPGTPTSG